MNSDNHCVSTRWKRYYGCAATRGTGWTLRPLTWPDPAPQERNRA
jgi:hypothetical protein